MYKKKKSDTCVYMYVILVATLLCAQFIVTIELAMHACVTIFDPFQAHCYGFTQTMPVRRMSCGMMTMHSEQHLLHTLDSDVIPKEGEVAVAEEQKKEQYPLSKCAGLIT